MTAKEKVLQVYPDAVCTGIPRVIRLGWLGAAISKPVLMFKYSEKHAWADAWRRIQAERKKP